MKREMVAPCGMNCNLCSWCSTRASRAASAAGRGDGAASTERPVPQARQGEIDFCYQCGQFPCENLLLVEKRYVHAHNYSFVENLNFIRRRGMPTFLKREIMRYTCPSCGKLLTVHSDKCPHCRQRHNRKDRR